MPINSDKTQLWKADVAQSIDFYNDWFLRFAPGTYRKQRVIRTKEVHTAFEKTDNLETQQYGMLTRWLLYRGYKQIASDACGCPKAMPADSFSFCCTSSTGKKKTSVNPTYCIVKPADTGKMCPHVIIEAKSSENISSSIRSAKRDARKFATFKEHLEKNVQFILLLCGYFDGYYLGPQAAEGIDWVWQHRLDDLKHLLTAERTSENNITRA